MSVLISVEDRDAEGFRASPEEKGAFTFDPDAWVELAYPCKGLRSMDVAGKRVKYEHRFTPAGMAKMVEKFRAAKEADPELELLVNVDHLAHDKNHTTEAAAWVTDLKIGEDGHLYGKFRWTTLGNDVATGGVYRFPSVEVDSDDTPRADWPTKGVEWDRFDGAAITNDHAMKKLRPFCFRAEPDAPIDEENETQPKGPKMENLKIKLGLPPEATDAEVEAAVQALLDKAAADSAAAAEAEMTQKAEAFRTKHADRFTDAAAAEAFFRALPDQAEELVGTFRVVQEEKPVGHRGAGNPDQKEDSSPAGMFRKWSEMPDGPEKDQFLDAHTAAINAGTPAPTE